MPVDTSILNTGQLAAVARRRTLIRVRLRRRSSPLIVGLLTPAAIGVGA